MQAPRVTSRHLVADTRRRDLLVAVIAGAAMLGFILYALIYFSREVHASGMTEGVIVQKTFVPRPETQITFGQGGLNRRELSGEYSFQVRAPQENNREYRVLVDPHTYEARKVGDPLWFKKSGPGGP